MLSREGQDNTIKAIHLRHLMRRCRAEGLVLSTDAEEAFNRVSWDYMTWVLQRLDLQPNMLTWLMALCSQPGARVRVNGVLYSRFDLSKGTRQGCTLLSSIFILCLEPFLCTLWKNLSSKGVTISDREYLLAAFADNILLFLSNPLVSVPNLMKAFADFKQLLNQFQQECGPCNLTNPWVGDIPKKPVPILVGEGKYSGSDSLPMLMI